MFKSILTLFLSVVAINGISQQFNAVVTTSQMDFLSSGVELTNGQLIVGGFTSGLGETGNDVFFIRMNHLGERIWSKTLINPGEDGLTVMKKYNDNLLLFGGVCSTDLNGSQGSLAMMDIEGNLLWHRDFGGEPSDEVNDITVCENGKIFIAGSTTSFIVGDQDIFISMIDDAGNVEWSKIYGTSMYEKALGTAQDLDGNLYVWGHQSGDDTNGYDSFIMKFDPLGHEMWNRKFSLDLNELAWDIVVDPNGDLMLSGDTGSAGKGQTDIYLIRMTTDGDVVWSKTFGSHGSEHGTSICKLKNDMYLITGGTGSFGEGGLDFLAMYVNNMGDMKYAKSIGGEIKDISVGSFKTQDGGAVLLGNTRSFGEGYTSGFMAKIDNSSTMPCHTSISTELQSNSVEFNIGNAGLAERGEGMLISLTAFPNPTDVATNFTILCDDQIEGVAPSPIADSENAEVNRLRLLPNPSNGVVKAYITLQESESGKLEVFDLDGRIIQFHPLGAAMNGEVRSIQLNHLTHGIYLTRLSIGNNITSKKLIVE